MWYVLQVKTGTEVKTAEALARLDFVTRVSQEERPIRSGGKWTVKTYLLFPSYVFVSMEYNAANYYRVKGNDNVIQFLGAGGSPSPLTELEAEWVKDLSRADHRPIQPTKARLTEDGSVMLLDGPLQNFTGYILKLDKRRRRAKLEIHLCGQSKTVELSLDIETTAAEASGVDPSPES